MTLHGPRNRVCLLHLAKKEPASPGCPSSPHRVGTSRRQASEPEPRGTLSLACNTAQQLPGPSVSPVWGEAGNLLGETSLWERRGGGGFKPPHRVFMNRPHGDRQGFATSPGTKCYRWRGSNIRLLSLFWRLEARGWVAQEASLPGSRTDLLPVRPAPLFS